MINWIASIASSNLNKQKKEKKEHNVKPRLAKKAIHCNFCFSNGTEPDRWYMWAYKGYTISLKPNGK